VVPAVVTADCAALRFSMARRSSDAIQARAMKTGGILFFGGVVLLVLGGLGGLVFVGPLLRGQGGTFSNLLAVLVLGGLPAVAGLLLMAAGGRRSKLERENEDRGFTDLATALARKNAGKVSLDQVA